MIMNICGFAGKSLYINLSTGKIMTKSLDRKLIKKFIGGVGITSWMLYNFIDRKMDSFSPENVLIFGVPPLVGTLAPGASRVFVQSRSPVSGFLSQASAGHSMGVMMKYAGYDNLVITGRAENPVYLKILDDEVEILDARHLWGRDSWETADILRKEVGDYWIDCIGPAGENLVRYSILMCSKRSSFNKAGIGAVMGSKNLKAIAARGTKGIKVADPNRFKQLVNKIVKQIVSEVDLWTYRSYGEPSTNFSKPYFTLEEFQERIAKKPYACLSCPVACKHVIELRDGNHKGLCYRVSHLVALAGHNSLAAPENWDELAKCVELENSYGMEAAGTAAMLNYLVGCYEHGILTKKEISFVPKRGGTALRELISMIVQRKQIGALAAEGLLIASQKVNKDSEKYAAHIKGIGCPESEISSGDLGPLTNPRGGHGELTLILNSDTRQFCSELKLERDTENRICDGPNGCNIGRLTKWLEDYTVIYSSMGFCIRPILRRHISLKDLCELYLATTGIDISPAQLLFAGERVFNLLKAFNVKMGATRLDDLPSRGAVWSPDKLVMRDGKEYGTLKQILDEYYDERGWDVETGVPTREKLSSLGLQNIADLGV
jgi:aldehyde:ferredoxin oxidoreductase